MTTPSSPIHSVACPFCGLRCDDLTVARDGAALRVVERGCALGRAGFEAPGGDVSAQVRGREATLAEAASAAAALLAAARQPVFGTVSADVAGARAALELADRVGAVLDHHGSAAQLRNLLTVQDGGWLITTLSEVRNRVDLLICAGTDLVSRFPRFFERVIWNSETLFAQDTGRREVVYLGSGLDTAAGVAPDGRLPAVIPCDPRRLGEVANALRALVAGQRLQAQSVAGAPLAELEALAARMKAARYGVLAWSAGDLDFPHAELTTQAFAELVKALNAATRFSGLPMGGSEGDITFSQVATWQLGYPTRVSLARGRPDYDPWLHDARRLVERGEADLLVWIAALREERVPPAVGIPTIVLGRSGMKFERTPEVFIPVGTPGLDHAGHVFRTDNVVAVPLKKLRESALPSASEALAAIGAALEGAAC